MAVSLLAACKTADSRSTATEFVQPIRFEQTGGLQAPGLNESSGVAASRQHPGLLWTHNDSGDEPVLYLTNLAGDHLGVLRLEGAQARDWEDMTIGRCPEMDRDCLYVGDTGDNNLRRSTARLFVVPEPESLPLPENATARARRIDLLFPDRPFNIEAIAATPEGDIWMVSKGLSDTAIFAFRLSASELTRDSISVKPLFIIDFPPVPMLGQLVTGAAISRDGSTLVMRTYTQIFYYEVMPDRLKRLGLCWLGYREPQGEAIDFLEDDRMVLTSESEQGGIAPIHTVTCPVDRN